MRDRSEWTRGPTGPQTIKGANYKNLTEFKRPCVACGELFSIFVTQKIANGHADSNSFGLKNCEAHRRNRPPADTNEVETLRTANATMREELVWRTAQVKELEARLAIYELPAMVKVIGCETVQNTTNSSLPNRFPWE